MICICIECGAEIEIKKQKRIFCDSCLKKHKAERNRKRIRCDETEQKKISAYKKRADLSAKKLDAVVIAAKKAGLSYGEYVARQRMEENKGA